MPGNPFILIAPATRGLSLALTRHYLRTTHLPVFATYRTDSPTAVQDNILSTLPDVDPLRLNLIRLELTSEDSIANAAEDLGKILPSDRSSYIHTAFFTGGVLHPERQPADLDAEKIRETFEINIISHLLLIKHFSRFLPSAAGSKGELSKWVHVSARVGSISDNRLGGWYSYRASKAALNQAVRSFDLQLQAKKIPAIAVSVHPGTVKTNLSREFWGSVKKDKLFEPAFAAERLSGVVAGLGMEHRGKIWDWAGEEVQP